MLKKLLLTLLMGGISAVGSAQTGSPFGYADGGTPPPPPEERTPGQIAFSTATQFSVLESVGSITIAVARSGGDSGSVGISYQTRNGSAGADTDYIVSQGTLTWAEGETGGKFLQINIINDEQVEAAETIQVILTQPTGGATLTASQLTITITDDDEAPPASEEPAQVNEVAQNPTQLAVAIALDEINAQGSASPALQAAIDDLTAYARTAPEVVANALQQIAPEEVSAQGSLSLEINNVQHRNIQSRLYALREGVRCLDLSGLNVELNEQIMQTPFFTPDSLCPDRADLSGLRRIGVFVNGHLNIGDKDDTTESVGYDFDTYGVTAGADYRFTDRWVSGLAIGYAETSADFNQAAGNLDVDGYSFSIYNMVYEQDKFYVDAIYSYGDNSFDMNRAVNYRLPDAFVEQTALSETDSSQHAASVGFGHYFHHRKYALIPNFHLDYQKVDIDSFDEVMSNAGANGSGLAMHIDDQDLELYTMRLGIDFTHTSLHSWGLLVPNARFHAVHEFDFDARRIKAHFVEDNAETSYEFYTDQPDSTYFNLGLGIMAQFAPGSMLYVDYATPVHLDKVRWHAVTAGLRFAF